MSEKIVAKTNQSMMNLIMEACGTLEGAMDFCVANGVSVTDNPVPGTEYVVPDGIAKDAKVLRYFKDNGIVPANANHGVCGVAAVSVDSYDDTSVTFTYTAGTNGVGVEWAVLPAADAAPETGTLADSIAIVVTGLTPGTDYKAWVRTKCWGGWSGWVSGAFTTTEPAPLLTAEVILYPVQKATVGKSGGLPVNYYLSVTKKNPDFIATYGLRNLFLTTNKMYVVSKTDYVSSELSLATYLSSLLTTMLTGAALYNTTVVPGVGEERIYCCDTTEVILTHTYKDINNNEAVVMPVAFVNDNYDTWEFLLPKIDMEVVEATSSTVTVRLTRSHPVPTWPDVNLRALVWRDDALSGTPDPDDPMNPDMIIMVLSAGVTTVGVSGEYETDDSVTMYPRSKIQMCIEVA